MPEKNWKEALKRVSLMGLNATQIEPELQDFFLTQDIKGDHPQQVLAGISLLGLQERVHFQFKKNYKKQDFNPILEENEFISPQQNNTLTQILNKEYTWAMYEFISQIHKKNLLIPAFWIPELLRYALSENWLKPWILELTGRQGAWALSHIPDWDKSFQEIPTERFIQPRPIERKLFPLLNIVNPLPNLSSILHLLDFPALIWSPKLSKRMHEYLIKCLKSPHIDILMQEDMETIIHFTSYLTDTSEPTYFSEGKFDKMWSGVLDQYNQVLKFRVDS